MFEEEESELRKNNVIRTIITIVASIITVALIATGIHLWSNIKESKDSYNNLVMETEQQAFYDATTINAYKDYIERKYNATDVKIDLGNNKVTYSGKLGKRTFSVTANILDEKELIN